MLEGGSAPSKLMLPSHARKIFLLWRGRTKGESKRGEAPLKNTSPSPYQGEGDTGDGVDK